MPDYAAVAETYCRQIQDGTNPACKWVKLATKRHLTDLDRQATPAFPYRFDPQKAARACAFIEHLPHIKGRLAGSLIRLEPFQVWIIASIFGWVNHGGKKDGKRRFRRAYCELPRKQGKSAISSGIALYMLSADGEGGADCYSAATTRDQARIVFDTAQAMARSKA